MRHFGRKLIGQTDVEAKGVGGKDVMSVLLRANATEESRSKLSDSEVIDQISYVQLHRTFGSLKD